MDYILLSVNFNFMAEIAITKEGNKDKWFKGQHENEELICFFRRHWVTVLPQIGFLCLFVLLETTFVLGFPMIKTLIKGNTTISLLYIGIIVGATIYLHNFFLELFRHFMSTVIFTDARIIENRKSIFLHDSSEILDLIKVQDVRKSQEGILKNLLRYGDMTITLSSSEASKLIKYVPNVNFHSRCLAKIKREAFTLTRLEALRGGEARGLYDFSPEAISERILLESQRTGQVIQKTLSPKI